jgi:hypothetical protein
MKILGREPVVITTLIATLLQLINAFWLHWSDDQTAAINGAIAVVMAVVATGFTSVDRVLPLLSGVAQALITLGIAFGWHVSADKVTAIMAVISAFVAFFGVRPQVGASIGANGTPVPKQPMLPRPAAGPTTR